MKKRILSAVLSIALILSLVPAAFAAESDGQAAAQQLYEMDLFQGTGVDESGNPITAHPPAQKL